MSDFANLISKSGRSCFSCWTSNISPSAVWESSPRPVDCLLVSSSARTPSAGALACQRCLKLGGSEDIPIKFPKSDIFPQNQEFMYYTCVIPNQNHKSGYPGVLFFHCERIPFWFFPLWALQLHQPARRPAAPLSGLTSWRSHPKPGFTPRHEKY